MRPCSLSTPPVRGLREQTRRHCFLLSLLGLRQIVVAVNKMDLVDYRQEVFDRIRTELGGFLAKLGVEPAHFVPISAKHGEGLLRHSERMAWYRGPMLLDVLERFHANPPLPAGPCGFPSRMSTALTPGASSRALSSPAASRSGIRSSSIPAASAAA